MHSAENLLGAVSRLLEAERPREAFTLFVEQTEGKDCEALDSSELRALGLVCQRLLPQLLEHHTSWMVNHPAMLRRMLVLLRGAVDARFQAPLALDQIAWFRCLLAISEAMAGRPERVHEELCLARGRPPSGPVPPPNGTFEEQTRDLEFSEGAATAFLRPFFAAYVAFLRRVGRHELANHIEGRVGRLLGLMARDETRPGVVQALFYARGRGGHARFVHVSLTYEPRSDAEATPREEIVYAREAIDRIDTSMKEAASWARAAADACLRRAAYPDGLLERQVLWEIATLRGDAVDLPREYEGGSLALPLAVAIVSEYLARPVPNDVAFTGTFAATEAAEGRVLPVDGIPEKVEHAVKSGCRVVYVPSANAPEIDEHPALGNLVAEHDARVKPVERVDEVCEDLFPPEGSGHPRDVLKDTASGALEMLGVGRRADESQGEPPAHCRHRGHAIAASVLLACLVFLEGWMVYKAFAPQCRPFEAWARIVAAAGLALGAMWVVHALPGATLRHRKRWSWFAGIGLLTAALVLWELLLGTMLPATTAVSHTYNAPPAAGLLKDLFLIWLFAWALPGNVFNVVAALEHLVDRRQFVTARDCLRWNAALEQRMPIRSFYFPWKYGAIGMGLMAALLMGWELQYYGSLESSAPEAYWLTFLGLGRDLLFIAAIAESMIFYKVGVSGVRRVLA